MDPLIQHTFYNAAQFHQSAMNRFRPCKPHGEMSEANLTFSFIHSALEIMPSAGWGLEVPFSDNPQMNSKWNKHIDAFLFADGILYLIEVKRDYPVSDFSKRIYRDLGRMMSPGLADSFVEMLNRPVYSLPFGKISAVKAVILADTWRQENVRLWKLAELKGKKQAWLSGLHRDYKSMPFTAAGSKAPYTLLIGQTDNLTPSLKKIQKE